MALTLVDFPYKWTLRGQKLLYRVSSTNTTNDGFKYGIVVTENITGKQFEFFIDRSPATSNLLFDLSPVVKMFNDESTIDMHTAPSTSPWTEPEGGSWKEYNLVISEWWLVNGVLTENEEDSIEETTYILNGYYQPKYGYKPDVFSGEVDVRLSLGLNSSRAWSDRFENTHTWWDNPYGVVASPSFFPRTYIPCFNSDYGLLYISRNTMIFDDATHLEIKLYLGNNPFPSQHLYAFTNTSTIMGVGVYPMNINDSSFPSSVKPASNPTWSYYTIQFVKGSGTPKSMIYAFYNAEKYGQFDCRYDYVRLAWVNSRSGWDYFNFIKKNEINNDIERKQYKRLLINNEGTFDSWQRQLTDRQAMVTQSLTITSDWIQENEFVFLRNLYASNQVEIIDTNGNRTPVSIADTSFLERKERNGKLYNITIKLNYSQDYWT